MQRHRSSSKPAYDKWYKTSQWQKLRWSVLLRDGFTCQCGCNRLEHDTSQLVADHKIPHRGDPALFWDASNLQTLTKHCHDSDKQRIEKGGKAKPTYGSDGWPI
jgi:5-methylcytosine-specific restriction protein A